ncbi:DUF4333 domain-containing protein [Nocardia bovistercoris]|uniref:DUF4333 domain-containing protein n=1 Tax=Nocardia bovistercoris TaxID=2785916 RepID=A0A931IEP8_9NOCA|nr:DUF4333 domain-containing protein [Nocardia bovistercoris]MBH0779861.1 DUF4333 domain-containing protein [Nocardia bovistercoris]
MTVPTRPPNTSRPYPVADNSARGPESEYTANGWVPVIIAGVVAAFVIAIAGVIAGLVVVNIRESAPQAPKPAAAQSPATIPAAAPLTEAPPIVVDTAVVDHLDPLAVQRGVVRVLGESYGVADVREVKCPGEQPVEIGVVFDCTARVDGLRKTVTVTVTDRDGTYEVSRPH